MIKNLVQRFLRERFLWYIFFFLLHQQSHVTVGLVTYSLFFSSLSTLRHHGHSLDTHYYQSQSPIVGAKVTFIVNCDIVIVTIVNFIKDNPASLTGCNERFKGNVFSTVCQEKNVYALSKR